MTETSTLTSEQRALLPTDDDLRAYREHGWWISPVIIPDDVLDAAERGMQRYYAGDLDRPCVRPGGWTAPPSQGLRKDDYASLSVDELTALVRHPMIGATAARLSGAAGIRLWHDQLLYKPVDQAHVPANVGWHTDRQYWLSCTSTEMLTAWVAFHDVSPGQGSVGFFDGSHRWDVAGTDFFRQDLDVLETSVRAQGHHVQVVPTTMRRGQVSFHHCRTVHGSGPNTSDAPRRSIAIHLQPDDNRVAVAEDGSIADHLNNELTRVVDGYPDFTDERICPQLWPLVLEAR